MAEFIKLTKITNWKIDSEKGKKEPTTTKTVYVRPCDIASFEEDDGATVVRFFDDGRTVSCGIHVKETAEEIFKMINITEYHLLTGSIYDYNPFNDGRPFNDNKKDKIFFDDGFWWSKPFKAEWTNKDAFEKLNSNTPYYGYAIIFGNGEIWE